ncbi:serine/threonine-protein kinase [Streptacidiphilus sp. N1-12]|uniref:Serine/threonine-protein kinase n=2 Tax=Streptacidiphilus alkalitolerans TaxID=3342712 RepID=A0ABV6WHU8_9ACTN
MSMGNGGGSDRLVAGRYRLLSRLGRGGMGTVWRAEDELLNRQVAVKEVHLRGESSAVEREQQRGRTLREARAVAQVRHPSVVGIHDVVEQDGEPWIVMELVDGTSLGGRLAAEGPLPPREAAALGLAVLSALEAAHSRGVLHRDVKPDNVLLERDSGRVVLTDFGIARLDGSATLTEAGAFLGSPEFTAPERTAGGEAGPESDLWSVGVLLCTALEGRSPFRRDSMSGVLYAVLYEDIVLPASAEPLADVVRGLLQRDPAQRMTAVQASWLLSDYLERESGGVSPTADTLRTAAGTAAAPAVASAGREPGPEPVRDRTLPELGGAGAERERGVWRSVLVGAGVVVAAAALAAGGVLLFQHGSGNGANTAGGPAGGAASSSASASVSASPTASPTATATPSATSTTAAPTTPAAVAVPAGYTFRHDPKGFSLAVPDGWGRSIGAGGRIFYISPDQKYRIGIHPPQAVSPKGVLATLEGQDAAGPKNYPGYKKSTVQPTSFHNTDDAAIMQWTWNGYPADVDPWGSRRVQDLSWTEGGRTYDFWVSAPTGDIDQADRYYQIVSSTFRAG